MSTNNEGRRQREEQREAEVVEALEKLRFLESYGLHPRVVTPDGKIAAFLGPLREGEQRPEGEQLPFGALERTYNDLHEMHKNDRKRGILLEAWGRFQEEESS